MINFVKRYILFAIVNHIEMRIKIYSACAYENSSIIFPIKDKCQHEIQAFISKDDKRGLKQKEQKKKILKSTNVPD